MKFVARAAALVVLTHALAPGALAYIGSTDCTFDGEEFDFCINGQTGQIDNDFYWTYSDTEGTLTVLLDASTPYWQAFGFSPQTETGLAVGMAGSSVVMGCADFVDTTGDDGINAANYFLSAKSLAGVTVADDVTEMLQLTEYSSMEVDDRCIVRFVRPLAPTGLAAGLQISDALQRIVMARGQSDMLGAHGSLISNRVFFDVNFVTGDISIEGNTALEDIEEEVDDDDDMDNNGAAAVAAPLAAVSFVAALVAGHML